MSNDTKRERVSPHHWSYRATRQTVDGEVEWAVREVYFDADGKALGWTEDAIAAVGDSRDDLAETLRRMLASVVRTEVDHIDLDDVDGIVLAERT